jgi:heme o synthase
LTQKLIKTQENTCGNWKSVPFQQLTPRSLLKSLGELSKFKLSSLVVLTTMSGHIMATSSVITSPGNLALTLTGTALCSFAANSLNQWAEGPLDAQMPRTQNRPIPRLALTPFAAFNWALLAAGSGLSILTFGVNPMAAGLAGLTIVLYAGVYTPLKRISILNTWVGALVGAIPPLIGWTAVSPHLVPAAFVLPAVLFCWQFPHFNALSWNLRAEYARAGYKMASVLYPKLNGRVALRYSLALIPITLAASSLALTTPLFALTGNLANAPLIFQAIRFWRNPERKSARGLFFASLLHLPIFMTLLFVHRRKNNKN